MGFAVERHNYTSINSLAAALVTDMQANGFKVLSLNGTANPSGGPVTVDDTITKVLMAPTTDVDPIAVEDTDTGHANYLLRQPWRFVIEIDHDKQAVRWYACTPTNIISDGQDFQVATSFFQPFDPANDPAYNNVRKTGLLTTLSQYEGARGSYIWGKFPTTPHMDTADGDPPSETNHYSWRYEHFGFDVRPGKMDRQSVPLSYRLSISDHGIAFCLWTEAYDSAGNRFHWWNIQRMVNKDTGATIIGNEIQDVKGKAPLFCVFSMVGGGASPQETLPGGETDSLNVAGYHDAYYFVVRESDVHAPTFPVAAAVDTADSNRIINMVQQVSISESNKLVIQMMKGLNTQRFAYPHELDMIAYVSADVVSQFADINVRQYGEAQDRSFKALKANHAQNKGMRILMLQKGAGIGA
jgi:hypothetical protein